MAKSDRPPLELNAEIVHAVLRFLTSNAIRKFLTSTSIYTVYGITMTIRDTAGVERAYTDGSLDVGETLVMRGFASPDAIPLVASFYTGTGLPMLGAGGMPIPGTDPAEWTYEVPHGVLQDPFLGGTTFYISITRPIGGGGFGFGLPGGTAVVKVVIKSSP